MKVLVVVTAGDVAEGVRWDPASDPIARAIKRALPDRPVNVYRDGIIVGGDEIKSPWPVQDFVATFDDFGTATPISFEIEVSEAAA